MGIIPAIGGNSSASGPGVGAIDPAIGIQLNEIGPNLSHLPGPSGWHLQASPIEARQRQVALLAQLVASIDNRRAEQTAIRLLNRFGSLAKVFRASYAELLNVAEHVQIVTVILASKSAVVESLREDLSGVPFDIRDKRVLRHLVSSMQGCVDEEFYTIFLDQRRCFLLDDRMAIGGQSHLSVRSRPILRRAVETSASWIVLVHNHPSGDLRPSRDDITFTRAIESLAKAIGVGILDHIIVSGPSIFSMRATGILK